MVVKSIISNSSAPNRDELLAALDDAMKQMQQKSQNDPAQQAQMAQIQVQQDQNAIAREKMQQAAQEYQYDYALKEKELMLDERKVAILEQAQEVEAAKLSLQEMDIHLQHEAAMSNVAVKSENNQMDYQTNALNADEHKKSIVLDEIKVFHGDLNNKVDEIAKSVANSEEAKTLHNDLIGSVNELVKTIKTPKKRKIVKNPDGSKTMTEE